MIIKRVNIHNKIAMDINPIPYLFVFAENQQEYEENKHKLTNEICFILSEKKIVAKGIIFGGDPTPSGTVLLWAGNTAPEGYLLCDGRELAQRDYSALYSAIGDQYNSAVDKDGNPYTTSAGNFRLPDLRGRFVVGQTPSGDYASKGAAGGQEKVKLTGAQCGLQAHTHTASTGEAGKHSHSVAIQEGVDAVGHGTGGDTIFGGTKQTGEAGAHTHTVNIEQSQAKDAEEAHENRPPFYTLAYIIKT